MGMREQVALAWFFGGYCLTKVLMGAINRYRGHREAAAVTAQDGGRSNGEGQGVLLLLAALLSAAGWAWIWIGGLL